MSCLCRITRTVTGEIVHWSGRQDCHEAGRETDDASAVSCGDCDAEIRLAPYEKLVFDRGSRITAASHRRGAP